MNRDYVVITPCRNEEDHIDATIRSITGQTIPPKVWVIVDDGSSDRTPDILRKASAEHPMIQVVRREDRGGRSVGPGVIEAVYAGLETVDLDDFEYLCKFDADLEVDPGYFEGIIRRMEEDPLLGNFSGKVYFRDEDGTLSYERMGDENAIGAAKFYRVACFQEIGGFVRQLSWDGIDGHMCRMNGWIAMSRDLPEFRIIHRRLMGSSHLSVWEGRKRWGRGKWYLGSAWYYVLAVSAYRVFEKPFFIGGLGILFGYGGAAMRRLPRFPDTGFRAHLRRHELRSLLRGKRRATEFLNERIRAEAAEPGGGHRA